MTRNGKETLWGNHQFVLAKEKGHFANEIVDVEESLKWQKNAQPGGYSILKI